MCDPKRLPIGFNGPPPISRRKPPPRLIWLAIDAQLFDSNRPARIQKITGLFRFWCGLWLKCVRPWNINRSTMSDLMILRRRASLKLANHSRTALSNLPIPKTTFWNGWLISNRSHREKCDARMAEFWSGVARTNLFQRQGSANLAPLSCCARYWA